MAKKRRLVYRGHHGREGEEASCLWCGTLTTSRSYLVNPGGTPVLKCCCEDCWNHVDRLLLQDNRLRPVFYVVIAICTVASWVGVGVLNQSPVWTPVPFAVLMLVLVIYPRVLPRYEYYLPLGVVRTRHMVRMVASLLFVLALYLVAVRFGVVPA